jgi:hypothetical protein
MTLKRKLRIDQSVSIFGAIAFTYLAGRTLAYAFTDSTTVSQCLDAIFFVADVWLISAFIRAAIKTQRIIRSPFFYLAAIKHDLGTHDKA